MGVVGSVRFVDKVGENYLFRGPHFLKDNDTVFDFASLKEDLKFERPWLPDRYYLVDIMCTRTKRRSQPKSLSSMSILPRGS